MWETLYGMVTAYPIVSYIFIPVYFSLGITSVYQYLDLRYFFKQYFQSIFYNISISLKDSTVG